MTLALYTCIVSPHQIPLARAIMRLHPEMTFYYVYTQELPPDATRRSWKWLRQHRLGGVKLFLKTAIFTFLRRHFYIRPIRRWHIRRMYPHVTEWKARA